MILSDLSRLFIKASVDESDIGVVQLGQLAVITADAFPGKRFLGNVERIATKGVNVSNVVTFEVKIEVQGKDKTLLKPEMTTNVEIIAIEKDEVLPIPEQTIFYKKGKSFVRVKTQDVLDEREIKTGVSDGVSIEILEGLDEEETVACQAGNTRSDWRANRSSPGLSSGRGMRMLMGAGGRR